MRKSLLALSVLVLPVVGGAKEIHPGISNPKDAYSVFHPTPRAQMREMTMDRPDTTETPHTVDAGHFQIETSILTYTYDGWNTTGERANGFSVMQSMLKLGITNNMDIELGIEPYVYNSTFDLASSTEDVQTGFGDLVPRMKITVFGNDSGPFSIALLPFVKFPTHQGNLGNNSIETGLTIPYMYDFTEGWAWGGQAQFNASRRTTDDGYVPEFINTIEICHDFTEKIGAFLEFYSGVTTEVDTPWVGRIDTGVTYSVTPNFVLDVAVNVGVTKSADDVNPFFGFSYRH